MSDVDDVVAALRAIEASGDGEARLGEAMVSMGITAWEVGPDGPDGFYLALPAANEGQRAAKLKSVLERQTGLSSWRILNQIPPRAPQPSVSLGANGPRIEVSEWRFVIFKFDDGMTEIDVHVPEDQIKTFDSADLARVANITLVGALGSEVFDRRVESFFLKPLE